MSEQHEGDIPLSISTWEKLAIRATDYDVTIPEINEAELKKIGVTEGTLNLSAGEFSASPFPASGRIHDSNARPMISLICRQANKPKSSALNRWFLVDPGSLYTYITKKTMHKLIGCDYPPTSTNTELPHYIRVAIQNPNSNIEC